MPQDNNQAKILLVDDTPGNLDVMLEHLGNHQFNISVALNGYEAIELAQSIVPDIILMDVMMPILDGPGAFEKLKADSATSHLPVVFLTAKAMESEIARLLDMGAVGVITKPFQPATLHEEVQALWEKFHADK